MNNTQRLRAYLNAYASKDLNAVSAMLADDITLKDWNLWVEGKSAVLLETQKNFEAAVQLEITVNQVFEFDDTAAATLEIRVNENVRLDDVDVLRFNSVGQILSIRAYKG
jgi:ketosteroid isomerase-like protein